VSHADGALCCGALVGMAFLTFVLYVLTRVLGG